MTMIDYLRFKMLIINFLDNKQILIFFNKNKINRFFLLLSFLAVLLFTGCAEVQTSTPSPAVTLLTQPEKPLQSFLNDYDGYFRDSMILSLTPGAAVVIVKDSQVVFLKGYGHKVDGISSSVGPHTVFRIGSLSKGFAGMLTGILVEKGYLNWEDKVQERLPEFNLRDPKQASRIEIRHLLSHTTGMPYHAFSNLIEEGFDRETIMNYFPTAKLAGREGEFFGYQNVAFCLIEPILQSATGKTYQQLLEENIFRPAGMTDASCDFESMQQTVDKALPHRFTEAGWFADTVSSRYYGFAAAGGVNASISDMGEWLKVLLGQKPEVVSVKILDEVFTPVIGTGLERPVLPGLIDRDSASYAMGWRILAQGTDTLVYHAGFVNNYHCEIALNRRDGIGVCVLLNAPSPLAGRCIESFFHRWEKYRQQHANGQ